MLDRLCGAGVRILSITNWSEVSPHTLANLL